jgi:hypothetical protein
MCKFLVPSSATLMQMGLNAVVAACYVFLVLVSVLTVRFFYVLWHSGQPESRLCATRLRCLNVLGSGEYVLQSCLSNTLWTSFRYGCLVYKMVLIRVSSYDTHTVNKNILNLGSKIVYK